MTETAEVGAEPEPIPLPESESESEPEVEAAVLRPASRSERVAAGAFGAYVLLAAPLLLFKLGSYFWFFRDDWFFITGRQISSVDDLFRPHGGHWSTVPVVVFRGLWAVFGVRTYLPYQLVVVAAHLGVVVLLRIVMRRAGVGPWIASLAAGALVLFGPGREDILWAFQVGFTGGVLFGLAQLLLADHDGPVGRRDGLALLTGALALMSTATGIVMIVVVGMAVLVRRGWKAALLQTAPLAVLYGIWSVVTHPQLASPFGRPTVGVVIRWVRSGQIGTFVGLGHFAIVAWLLAGLLVVGLVLTLLPSSPPRLGVALRSGGRLRQVAVPVALFIGSVIFMVSSSQARWLFGPQAARASRYVYFGTVLTLPLLAVAIHEVALRWRVVSPVVVGVLLVAVPANIADFDDQPFGPSYHRSRRDLITAAVRVPYARQLSSDVRPIADVFVSPGLDMGFLLQAVDRGKLNPSKGPIPPVLVNELDVRLNLSQRVAPRIPGSCRWIEPSENLRPDRGTQYAWDGNQGPIRVRPVVRGRPPRLWVPLAATDGTWLVIQRNGLEFDWEGAGPANGVRLCEVG